MKINTKDIVPKSGFFEYFVSEAYGCSIGINKHDLHILFEGKKVVLTGVPGAFTSTCTEKHLPDFIEKENEVGVLGIDDIFLWRSTTLLSWLIGENILISQSQFA